jgi:hypothetical protein
MDEAAYEAGESSGYADWVNAFDRILGMDVAGPTDACEQVLRQREDLHAMGFKEGYRACQKYIAGIPGYKED